MTTGEKIYNLRKEARITQEEFADKMEVTRQAVSKWESDAAYPETDKIIKIAQLFGVTCDYLLSDGAKSDDNALDRRHRSFLSMMASFALASIAVGLIVALICYFAISEWYSPLVGLGVIAGFLLTAFILISVGRYKFLAACSYSEADKAHLAKWIKIFIYVAVISLFCYLPAVAFVDLYGTVDVSVGWETITITVSVKAHFGLYFLTTLVYAAAGIFTARLFSAVHDKFLGKSVSATRYADAACLIAATCATAAALTISIYGRINADSISVTEGGITATAYVVAALAILVRSIIYRICEKTSLRLFIMQIISAALFLILGIWVGIYDTTVFNGYDKLFYTLVDIMMAIGGLFTISVIVLLVLTIIEAKKDLRQLKQMMLWLPAYICCGALLLVTVFDVLDYYMLIDSTCVYCLAITVGNLFSFKKKETSNV